MTGAADDVAAETFDGVGEAVAVAGIEVVDGEEVEAPGVEAGTLPNALADACTGASFEGGGVPTVPLTSGGAGLDSEVVGSMEPKLMDGAGGTAKEKRAGKVGQSGLESIGYRDSSVDVHSLVRWPGPVIRLDTPTPSFTAGAKVLDLRE